MTRNISPGSSRGERASCLRRSPLAALWAGRSVVLVGLMGAGKTSIGRRLAARLGLPFRDADAEIELAAGRTIPELFGRFGEPDFRDGERRVIRRLLAGEPIVLATGGGAFMDRSTRARDPRQRASRSGCAARCPRWSAASRRAATARCLNQGDPADILAELMRDPPPVYAEADLVVDCGDEPPDVTTIQGADRARAVAPAAPAPRGAASTASYDVVIGAGLLAARRRACWPRFCRRSARSWSPTRRSPGCICRPCWPGSAETGIEARPIVVPPGEALEERGCATPAWSTSCSTLGVERRTAVIALGGGVVGDLAGFAAATTLRGLPFIQVPTTLLAQVDSSVGGKTGINTRHGKNLLGAFHQPRMVLADTGVLATLPLRELRAGYAEIAKAGLIGDAAFFAWCEAARRRAGRRRRRHPGRSRSCAPAPSRPSVVGDDEREEKPNNGRALLNLGHTFGHALEAEVGYGGGLLHGEAVAAGLGLAFRLSARLGFCDAGGRGPRLRPPGVRRPAERPRTC